MLYVGVSYSQKNSEVRKTGLFEDGTEIFTCVFDKCNYTSIRFLPMLTRAVAVAYSEHINDT